MHMQTARCLFCQIAQGEKEAPILARFDHCFAMEDKFPVSPGHILLIPFVHVDNWFMASEQIKYDMFRCLEKMKAAIDQERKPDGYNIGLNCDEAAGQTIMHLHLHLIPRYKGDMPDPRGGVRGVIPEKQKYLC